jgi:toxin ParE1/3/4
VFSTEAENDLMEIYKYGFLNYGENKADLYINALKEQCRFISSNPFICRERTDLTPTVRINHHKNHMVIYTIEADYVLIVRICHERMDVRLAIVNN